MGIAAGIAELLVEEHSRRPFAGRLLQYGRQKIHFESATLRRILRRYAMHDLADAIAERVPPNRPLSDIDFFSVFGFTSIEVLDVCDHENAEILYDLNTDALPSQYHGAYDCIFDGGTMEHVFHVPNFLRNTCQLLNVGGRIVHMNPASNSVDHGFYSFSPCLYFDFYTANNFDIAAAKLLDLGTRLFPIHVTAYDYPLDRKMIDGYLSGHVHYNWCVAAKKAESTFDIIPQQGAYKRIWAHSKGQDRAPTGPSTLASRAKQLLKRWPLLEWYAHYPFLRFLRTRHTRRALRRLARSYPG